MPALSEWNYEKDVVILYFSSRRVLVKTISQILEKKLGFIRSSSAINRRLMSIRQQLVKMGHYVKPGYPGHFTAAAFQLDIVDKWLIQKGGERLLKLIDWGDGTYPIVLERQPLKDFPPEKLVLHTRKYDHSQDVMSVDELVQSMGNPHITPNDESQDTMEVDGMSGMPYTINEDKGQDATRLDDTNDPGTLVWENLFQSDYQ